MAVSISTTEQTSTMMVNTTLDMCASMPVCVVSGGIISTSLVAILLNSVGMAALVNVKQKDNTLYTLASLATADILFSISRLVSASISGTICQCFGELHDAPHKKFINLQLVGSIFQLSSTATLYAGLFAMFFMTIERLVAVYQPHQFKQLFTQHRVIACICLQWVVAVTLAVSQALVVHGFDQSPNISYNWFQLAQCILGLTLVIVIIVCLVLLLLKVKHHKKSSGTTMICLIALTFVIFWLPSAALYLYLYATQGAELTTTPMPEILSATMFLLSLNQIANPIVYTTRHHKIRKELNELLLRWHIVNDTCFKTKKKEWMKLHKHERPSQEMALISRT